MSTQTSSSQNQTLQLRNVEKTSFTLPSPHNTSVLKKQKVTNTTPYGIHLSEKILPCHKHAKLPQLTANKSTLSQSYLHTVNPETYTPQCPLCLFYTQITQITSLTVVNYQQNH